MIRFIRCIHFLLEEFFRSFPFSLNCTTFLIHVRLIPVFGICICISLLVIWYPWYFFTKLSASLCHYTFVRNCSFVSTIPIYPSCATCTHFGLRLLGITILAPCKTHSIQCNTFNCEMVRSSHNICPLVIFDGFIWLISSSIRNASSTSVVDIAVGVASLATNFTYS